MALEWKCVDMITGEIVCGHYGGILPNIVPSQMCAIAYDLDAPNNVWYWSGSTWI